ncbi:aroma-sacti cluster domain-containing protein [Actinoplanes sp. NPDC049668]|uniref:aroma-sacti cluster domain-containing protein n=1 Tax=unclassified Actinoplanes TaxID=2626549 RepID=UPI0033BFAD03
MTDVYRPVDELRRQGLIGATVPAATEEVLNTLTPPQVDVFIKVKQRVDALEAADVQSQPVEDGSLALAMTRAMGWDQPRVEHVGAEVEGMALPPVAECACLCTGSGGGGGSSN